MVRMRNLSKRLETPIDLDGNGPIVSPVPQPKPRLFPMISLRTGDRRMPMAPLRYGETSRSAGKTILEAAPARFAHLLRRFGSTRPKWLPCRRDSSPSPFSAIGFVLETRYDTLTIGTIPKRNLPLGREL